MKRTLVTVLPELTAEQKERIRTAAENNGFTVLFFDTANEAKEAAGDAEILLAPFPELAEGNANLRWCATPFAGVERFCEPGVFSNDDVILTNGSGAYGIAISEHVIMVLLEVLRRRNEYAEHMRNHAWIRNLSIRSIYGSRITLLGTGDIGQACAKRLRAFEPESITGVSQSGRNPENLFDRVVPVNELDEVLKETDVLILSLPATAETFHILDARRLALLKDQVVVINVGRGSCIEEAALEEEVCTGRIYAALDVFEQEPLPETSRLWDNDHVLLTPHVAGDMSLACTVERIVDLFLENFDCYVSGKPLNHAVDRKRGY